MNTDQKWLPKLEWRSIGPYRGGRVVAVAGDPVDRNTFYFGACAGGIWKTTDGGVYWQNISDGHLDVSSIGAIAVSESDPSVIYAGTGEACIRGDVSHGDGVYKSSDCGKTWKNIGLRDTRHISRIRIHPSDSNHVFVAALGHAFGSNKERGVFRSRDGGCTWEHILFKSEKAGAIDLAMDPNNPRIIFASIWEALRTPWSLVSAGGDSGLWRSNDGGDNWEDSQPGNAGAGGIWAEQIYEASINDGDVNFDFVVNILDVVSIVNYILGNDSFTEEQFILADLNRDGVVNVVDLIQLVNMVLEPIEPNLDFALVDINPASEFYNQNIGPSFFSNQVSCYYFGKQG